MNLKMQKSKIVAGVATVLLVGSLAISGNYYFKNKGLIQDNNKQKLTSERLLSEKLLLDKEINTMKMDIASLRGKNKELDVYLDDLNNQLRSKEETISRLSKENAKTNALKKELASVKKMKDDLNKQVHDLNSVIAQLRNANDGLQNEIVYLKAENTALNNKIQILSAGDNANHFKVEALKGKKEKLTIKAGKTDKLNISFDLPENIGAVGEKKKLFLVITSPDGKKLPAAKQENVIVKMENESVTIQPSLTKEVKLATASKKVQMQYETKEKLAAGIYSMDVYSEDAYLGSVEVRLKK